MPMLRNPVRTAFLLCAFLATFTCSARAQSSPTDAYDQFMAAFNSGDMAKAAALNLPSTAIIDEFSPYTWRGTKAFADWGAAFEANSKALGITEPKVTSAAPIVKNMTGGHAYLVYPAIYTYRQKGVAMTEEGRIAIALRKDGDTWKIASWAWTGTVPKPVK